ncbi:hypothetical protein B0H14DRAFT_2445494 [Mycena olivaceomarginata]|nr:hypothetical protein B0H14DRAFT_2445494 [Mycena olivaceomarginata]
MDLTMQVTFNGQERTLREIVALALSAGWKVVRVTKPPGSLFGHIVAVPVAVPVSPRRCTRAGSGSAPSDVPRPGSRGWERKSGRDGDGRTLEQTPTLGSCVDLPSVAEARAVWLGRCRYAMTARRFAGSAPTPAFETGCGADEPAR